MAQLAVYRDFLTDFAKLEKSVQQRVSETFEKFENATHAGAHLEKISGLKETPFRTIRIDRFWRGVVLAPESGDTYTLLAVLPHDDAYEWARRRRASVNTATGRIEIRDVAAIDASMPQLKRMASERRERLFDHVGDAGMRRLGVDEQTLAFARALTDDFQLEAARTLLPQVQWEVLYGLAAGMSPEDVWQELGAAIVADQGFDTEDLDAAVRRSADRVLLVDGPSELLAVLADPFELWRIYLHPAQRSAVEATYRGPARVSGGPGTGKTVVALHRAYRLAQRGAGPVLLTTFTSTLAEQLQRSLQLLAESSGDTQALHRIRVEHVDRLAHRVFRAEHGRPTLLDNAAEQKLWEEITAGLQDDLPPSTVLTWREDGVLPGEIGVAARSNRLAEQAAAALDRAGVPVQLLARSGEPGEKVAVGTMHRMKGLEFRCLAVVGAGAEHLPAPRSLTPESQDPGAHARDLLRERCLLYVACTRARERLSVSWHGAPSPFLADLTNGEYTP